jgi:hypothetical protein
MAWHGPVGCAALLRCQKGPLRIQSLEPVPVFSSPASSLVGGTAASEPAGRADNSSDVACSSRDKAMISRRTSAIRSDEDGDALIHREDAAHGRFCLIKMELEFVFSRRCRAGVDEQRRNCASQPKSRATPGWQTARWRPPRSGLGGGKRRSRESRDFFLPNEQGDRRWIDS